MRADRLISILMLLQARGRMTAGELATLLEVSERTVYRDLEALNGSGVPVMTERGPGGGCTLPDKYRTDLTGLTHDEARSLFMSVVPGSLAELGLDKAMDAALLKLSAALPAVQREGVERVRRRLHVDTAHWFHPPEPVPYLRTLQEALLEDRCVRLRYLAASGARSISYMHPLGLVAKAGVWYLVAQPLRERRAFAVAQVREARQDITVYRVSRVREAEICDEQFERPVDFDLNQFWASWCAEFERSLPRYPVTVRVAPDIVPLLHTLYGDGVNDLIAAADPPDREGWTTIPLLFETFEAARSSILGIGTGAEVLEPEELRESVIRTAAGIVAFYTGGSARAVADMIAQRRRGD